MITQNRRPLTPPQAMKWLCAMGWRVLAEDVEEGVMVLSHARHQQVLVIGSEDLGILRARSAPEAARKLGAP